MLVTCIRTPSLTTSGSLTNAMFCYQDVNKQNMRFWGWQKSDECVQRPLHSEKVTVWSAISSHGIICPYFLEDDAGKPVTVNSEVYREQVIDRFYGDLALFCDANDLELDLHGFSRMERPVTRVVVIFNILEPLFPDRLISRRSDFPYPPRSPDLTPPDFYLWAIQRSYASEIPYLWQSMN